MKPIAWLTFGLLLSICTSCGSFSYLKAHPSGEKAMKHIPEDIVEAVENEAQ